MKIDCKFLGITCFLILLLSGSTYAQQSSENKGIIFKDSVLSNALIIAKQQHKAVFVDAFAVWCAPCQQLRKTTFKNKAVSAYFNSHFINVSIDVEKGDGEKFAEQYAVSSYPTLLFIDTEGKIINKIEGFVEPNALLKSANSIK